MKSVTNKENSNSKNFLRQLFSPAMGLAILGTFALVFSFYRAGQLSSLIMPKNEINGQKSSALKNKLKIDINSPAVIDIADSSEAAMLVISGNYKQAITQAIKDLTDNPPDYVPTILKAGEIISLFGDDKELGFGLLDRAISMAPNNQYVNLRYCETLMNTGRVIAAEPNLLNLQKKYPQWPDPAIALVKLHLRTEKLPQASTELVELINNSKNLNSKQSEQIALLLAKLGRINDGFTFFQNAAKAAPEDSFYATYCKDWIKKNPGSYETVLAMVKSNLAENKNPSDTAKQLNLEIKHVALLLLLNRPADAQAALEQANYSHPKNFDLQILQATVYVLLNKNDKAKTAFQTAASYYQPKFRS